MYQAGWGVERDMVSAVRWFKRAAEHGVIEARLCLGEIYEKRVGVPADPTEAERWYTQAAQLGSATAEQSLQRLHTKEDFRPIV
jgi:TPR repeat protein